VAATLEKVRWGIGNGTLVCVAVIQLVNDFGLRGKTIILVAFPVLRQQQNSTSTPPQQRHVLYTWVVSLEHCVVPRCANTFDFRSSISGFVYNLQPSNNCNAMPAVELHELKPGLSKLRMDGSVCAAYFV
jgi:hypothetical protein